GCRCDRGSVAQRGRSRGPSHRASRSQPGRQGHRDRARLHPSRRARAAHRAVVRQTRAPRGGAHGRPLRSRVVPRRKSVSDEARPAPARTAALEVVTRTLAGEYLAPTLRSVLDASDLEGVERSQVTDLAYGVVRRMQQIDAHLAPLLKQPAKLPPRVLTALRLGVLDLLYRHTPAHAAVSEWV